MRRNAFRLTAVALFTAALLAPSAMGRGEPPTDEQVKAAISTYHERVGDAAKSGQQLAKVMPGFADDAVKGLDFGAMSLDQLQSLVQSAILRYTHDTAPALARLGELAKEPGIDGARAAVLRLSLIGKAANDDEKKEIIAAALRHPGLAAALKAGQATEIFNALGSISKPMMKEFAKDLVGLAAVVPDDVEPAMAPRVVGLLDPVMSSGAVTPEEWEPLRVRCLAVIADAAPKVAADGEKIAAEKTEATPKARAEAVAAAETEFKAKPEATETENAEAKAKWIDDKVVSILKPIETREKSNKSLARSLSNSTQYLNGAFARGKLIDSPAPAVDFTWCSNDLGYKSFDDLKGKVVVVDFWATWCGPCIASFPKVRDLVKHYEGYPVTVLGITSIQGYHMDHSDSKKVARVDTKDDPAKEMSLMPEFMKQLDMTWPVAFTKQSCFNPDFGVRGIPHVAIVDTKGVVRFRGIHPGAVSLVDKCKMIDGLLKEAGLPTPPPPPPEEPKETDKAGG